MRQTIRTRFMRLLSCIAVIGAILGTCLPASCSEKIGAGLVNKGAPSGPVDYSDRNNWMKLPEITKDVDTVYIYPTEYVDDSEEASVFADINEKAMREPAKLTYLMQGTAYEDSTNVFAPYYRQVNMAAASRMNGAELAAAFNSLPK